jgi:hypothetical protein
VVELLFSWQILVPSAAAWAAPEIDTDINNRLNKRHFTLIDTEVIKLIKSLYSSFFTIPFSLT